MPVKYKSNCKICQAVKTDKALLKRLYNSRIYLKSGEPILTIANETGFSYPSLANHCKKHQAITDDDLTKKQLEAVQKQQVSTKVTQTIRSMDARQGVLEQLASLLEQKGEIQLGEDISLKDALNLILKAAKDTDDVQAKKKDQELDVFKLMTAARSGEVIVHDDKPFDPWEEGEVVG